jgi:hypothetical protein
MYSQATRHRQTAWVDDLFWVCTRHIPTSKKYFWSIESCVCGNLRPELSEKPSHPPEAPKPSTTNQATPNRPLTLARSGPHAPPQFPVEQKVPNDPSPSQAKPGPRGVPCAWPRCHELARVNSPYCSKICSDRCGRLRRKKEKDIQTPEDKVAYEIVTSRISQWESLVSK